MVETRVAPRYRVAKPAKIEFGCEKIACTILDLSVTGAALLLSELAADPCNIHVGDTGGRIETNLQYRLAQRVSDGCRVRVGALLACGRFF